MDAVSPQVFGGMLYTLYTLNLVWDSGLSVLAVSGFGRVSDAQGLHSGAAVRLLANYLHLRASSKSLHLCKNVGLEEHIEAASVGLLKCTVSYEDGDTHGTNSGDIGMCWSWRSSMHKLNMCGPSSLFAHRHEHLIVLKQLLVLVPCIQQIMLTLQHLNLLQPGCRIMQLTLAPPVPELPLQCRNSMKSM